MVEVCRRRPTQSHCLLILTLTLQEVLKQPLQTSVTVNTTDFADFDAEEMIHIIVSVKDFKNVVQHAAMLDSDITALYSQPSRPMQLIYGAEGLRSEITLMTIGSSRSSATPDVARVPAPLPDQTSNLSNGNSRNTSFNAAPQSAQAQESFRSAVSRTSRLGSRNTESRTGSQYSASNASNLFISAQDEDRQWEPANDRNDDEDMLGWDATGANVRLFHSFVGSR